MLAGESSSTQRVLVMRVLCPWEVEGAMRRSRGAKTSGDNSSRVRREGGSISDHSRGGGWGRRGGGRRGRRGQTIPEQPAPLGLPLQVQIVLLLALLPGPLVVVFLLQVPDGWPPVFLETLLVFWGRTAVGLCEEDAGGGAEGLPPLPRCHGTCLWSWDQKQKPCLH